MKSGMGLSLLWKHRDAECGLFDLADLVRLFTSQADQDKLGVDFADQSLDLRRTTGAKQGFLVAHDNLGACVQICAQRAEIAEVKGKRNIFAGEGEFGRLRKICKGDGRAFLDFALQVFAGEIFGLRRTPKRDGCVSLLKDPES